MAPKVQLPLEAPEQRAGTPGGTCRWDTRARLSQPPRPGGLCTEESTRAFPLKSGCGYQPFSKMQESLLYVKMCHRLPSAPIVAILVKSVGEQEGPKAAINSAALFGRPCFSKSSCVH